MIVQRQPKMKAPSCKVLISVACVWLGSLGLASNEPDRSPAVDVMSAPPLRTFARAGDLAVGVSCDGKLLSSAHRGGWIAVPLAARYYLRGVTWGKGVFVAVGGSYVDVPGVILTSCDGRSWLRQHTSNRANLYGVAYGNGQFVAVGDDDTILVSQDAIHWSRQRTGTSDVLLASVTFAGGVFVAVGDSGTILASGDALKWEMRPSGSRAFLSRVIVDQGRIVVHGSDGLILISTDGRSWSASVPPTSIPQHFPISMGRKRGPSNPLPGAEE